MTKLTVIIKPVEHYFFGTENRRSDDTQNYFLYSLPYPQQTTIIGAMRHLVLLAYHKEKPKENLLDENGNISDRILAGKLIGDTGFRIGDERNFGKINSISGLMLFDGKTVLLPAEQRKDTESMSSTFEDFEGIAFLNGSKVEFIPRLEGYDSKEPEISGWVSPDGKFQENGDIFKSIIRPGNKKKNTGDDDDDAFYKQEFYQLTNRVLCFVVQMDVEDDIQNCLVGKHIMTLGGERSKFTITIELSEQGIIRVPSVSEKEKYYVPNQQFIKVILTSDAYFGNDPYKDSLFAVTTTKPFRFLKSSVTETVNHYNRGKSKAGLLESGLFNLIERGSTFYFKNEEQLQNWKTSSGIDTKDFNNIGYNQFTIIQPKSK
jgi:CRISPR type III-B/RAMP module-associated protein Cmr3